MNEHNRESLKAYYAEAASWNRDRITALKNSRKVALWVAGGAGAIAIMEAIALMLLMPLKTVEPYTLLVDRTTGFVQPLKPLDPAKVAPDTALTQSYLVQYVIARESFDLSTVRDQYRKVALMSGDGARSSYITAMQVTNSASPLVTMPRGGVTETRVKSVSPIGRNVALVRFETVTSAPGGRTGPVMPWVAVMTWRYSGEPLSLEDRFVNPLGFQVVRYRRDAEALPAIPAAAAIGPPSAVPIVTIGMQPVTPVSRGAR